MFQEKFIKKYIFIFLIINILLLLSANSFSFVLFPKRSYNINLKFVKQKQPMKLLLLQLKRQVCIRMIQQHHMLVFRINHMRWVLLIFQSGRRRNQFGKVYTNRDKRATVLVR